MMVPLQSTNSTNSANNNNNNNGSCTSGSSLTQSARSPVQEYLTGCKSLYSCINCWTHLADHDELCSRTFHGNTGRAYLFHSVVNTYCGPAVQRNLTTGSHVVADIYCASCHTTVGWKYEKAFVESEKYKEGKYIIELAHVVRDNKQLEFDKGVMFLERNKNCSKRFQCTNHPTHSSLSASDSNSIKNPQYRNSLRQRASVDGGSGQLCATSSTGRRAAEKLNEEEVTSGVKHHNADDNELDEEEEEDEELMFPFYDDMCTSNRSSLPSDISLSLHNRMRRSLYLESTPYDWKYATSPATDSNNSVEETPYYKSEFNHQEAPKLTPVSIATTTSANKSSPSGSSLADSGHSSDLSSPSSSSDVSPEQKLKSYHSDDNNSSSSSSGKSNNLNSSKYKPKGRGRDTSENSDEQETDNDETQFKFEADRPESFNNNNNDKLYKHEQKKHCDQLNSNNEQQQQHYPPAVVERENRSNKSLSENEHDLSQDQMMPSTSSSLSSSNQTATNYGRAISLEDEEFYDCYSDHEVSNLILDESNLEP